MKFLRLKEVITQTGLGRSSIYKFMDEETFPPSVALGDRAVGWVDTEIEEWMFKKLSQRDNSVQA